MVKKTAKVLTGLDVDGPVTADNGVLSHVEVSDTGSATDEVQYIEVDGTEKKITDKDRLNGSSIVSVWRTGEYYRAIIGVYVFHNGKTYRCAATHWASDFDTDLAAGKWVESAIDAISHVSFVTSDGKLKLQYKKTKDISSTWTTTAAPVATTSNEGVMSCDDKTKLDSISTGATAVSVSDTGTATDEVSYITIDGVEKKIAGGGGGSSTSIVVSNATATFVSDQTYADYPYRASIAVQGCTANSYPQVTFSDAQAVSGNYAPFCESYSGGVYVYAKVGTTITIPTIVVGVDADIESTMFTLLVNDVSATFVSDATFQEYPYRATIPIAQCTDECYATVTFAPSEAESGHYSPICRTYDGGVYVYANVNTAITIPTIAVSPVLPSGDYATQTDLQQGLATREPLLSDAQHAAVNSGITSGGVSNIAKSRRAGTTATCRVTASGVYEGQWHNLNFDASQGDILGSDDVFVLNQYGVQARKSGIYLLTLNLGNDQNIYFYGGLGVDNNICMQNMVEGRYAHLNLVVHADAYQNLTAFAYGQGTTATMNPSGYGALHVMQVTLLRED